MARTSIKPEDTDIQVTSSTASTGLVPTSTQAPAEYDPSQYDDVGRDIETPVIGLVGTVGALAKQFRNQAGNFVLGDTLLGPAVQVIPVAAVKFYAERWRNGEEVKFGTPLFSTRKVFESAAAAAQAGYEVDFNNRASNRVEEAARIGYLVIAPEGDASGDFVIKAGDLRLSRAKCSYQRGGFRAVFRKIFDHANKVALTKDIVTRGLTHSELFARAQPWTHIWTLSAEACSGHDNEWFEPRIAKTTPLTAETIQWITENYGTVRA
jgi:hypothetical protein